ncbi:translocation/assembly module TamB domain-containing protein [Algoriphagus machipongonensis]|uniref:Outer membrane insertion C- signal n=1 Tax=Algoriphagus machipongonensis TaxID=388413 RepID=E2RUF3_9BACT|nr:translocation/assembly module TamB domain-containing protein [Algoriphagus machipongonensis]EFQ79255.1 putative outer membrane insertion C- signal [Algoriphagus machipongonensis]
MTAVQNWAVDQVTTYINKRSDFTTDIGKITLTWWDAVKLQDVTIRDHKDSLMIGAKQIEVDFELPSLIGSINPKLEEVRLGNPNLHLINHAGDSILNINLWVIQLGEIFGSGNSSSSTAKFGIDQVKIREGTVYIENLNYELFETGFDYNHLKFENVFCNAEDFYVQGAEIGVNIRMITGNEGSSNLEIQELITDFKYSPEFMEFADLSLRSEKTHIKNYLRFDFLSDTALANFVTDVELLAKMDESKINLEDLRKFAPNLPPIEDEIYLSGEVSGTISDMKSDEFLIRLGQKTALFGAFQLDGLPNIDDTYINLSLQNSTVLARDLGPYLNPEIEKEIFKFNTIRFDGDFAGYLRRFNTSGDFKTSIGDIKGRINFDLVDGKPSVVSRVTINELDLGILAEDRALFQKVSLDGNVTLQGDSRENILIGLDADISKIGLNNYNFSQISTDATYGLNLFKGNLEIADPNLKMQATGLLNLNQSVDSVRMQVNLDTAFLQTINLTDKLNYLSGHLNIDTKGVKIDDIQGIARFTDMEVGFEDRFLELGDFNFQSLFAGGTRTMSINSDYLVAAASGQFNLERISKDLDVLLDQYIAIILNEPQPVADLESIFSETYNLDLNIRMFDVNPIVQLFEPDLSISKNTILEGAFYQTPENTVFNFFTSIDTLSYKNKTAYATNIDFNTSKIINSEDILASFYIYSKAQELGKKIEFSNLGLEAIWDQNKVALDFTLDQDSTQSSARINANAQFSAQNTKISFDPSSLVVLDREWKFANENLITIIPGNISFSNVKIQHENQFIALDGSISDDPLEQLQLSLNQVNVDLLNTLVPQEFEGTANGVLAVEDVFEKPLLQGDIGIDSLKINSFLIGNLRGVADLNSDRLAVNLTNTRGDKKTIDMEGEIGLEYQDINIDANLSETNLLILEPFLSNYLSQMGGTVSGDFQIRGTTANPEVLGTGVVRGGELRVNFLNTSYLLDGNIGFKPKQISFRDLILKDVNGNRAYLTGGIDHSGFKDFYLNIKSNLTNFQVLNTTAKDNQTFYGSAFVSGTLDILGSTTNLDINARATSQPNTRIFIPLADDSRVAQEEFIHIINIQDTVRVREVTEEINRLDIENIRMNFILDITPDALAEIIIDPRTEEGITGRGRGVLNMNIDTQGNFSLTGNYEITEGKYNFSLYNIVKKQFNIRPGGRITWYGDPYEGVMDLTAEYVENVSIQPLLNATTTTDPDNTQSRRRYPVKVIMDLEGALLSPNIDFGFDFSQFPSSGDIQTTVSAFQNRIANDEQEKNRQVFSVIMSRSFSPEGQFSGVANISSSLGQLLSSQLNAFLGQVDKNLEIDVDLASLDANTLETFQLSVAYTFLDGRLRVSRDGGFTNNQGNANAASIIGDWQAEYLLTEDGVYRIRIFNRNNFNVFTSLSLSKNVATYGVSLSQNVSFNSFSELFQKLTRKKDEKLRINDTDDFLRYNYEDGERWTPINLDNIENRLDSLDRIRQSQPKSDSVPAKQDSLNNFLRIELLK